MRIKISGVELRCQLFIVCDWDLGIVHDPFPKAFLPSDRFPLPNPGRDRVNAPVDEHAEPGLPPPLHAGIALSMCFCVLYCRYRMTFLATERKDNENEFEGQGPR